MHRVTPSARMRHLPRVSRGYRLTGTWGRETRTMKLTGMWCAALVAVVALGCATPSTARAAGAEVAPPPAELERAIADLLAGLDAVQAEQDECVVDADADADDEDAAACMSKPAMLPAARPDGEKLDITGDSSSKACLMEGHYVIGKAGGATVNQKQCFENQGVAQADFKQTCEGLMQTAMWAAGGGSHKLTYMASCPPNPTSMCKRLFEQPVAAYYYKGSDEQAGSLCAEPVTL